MRARLTQEELADRSGMSVRTISDLERGLKHTPRDVTVDLLAGALGLSQEERTAFEAVARGNTEPIEKRNPHLSVRSTTLPPQLAPFIGRQQQVDALRRMLLRPDVRLLTLTGSGGVGKTRLAIEVAGGLLDVFNDGVHFVSLAAITEPEMVAPAIAQALGVNELASRSLTDSLEERLAHKNLLLVLDNFEQVVLAAPGLARLFVASPILKLLATSRVRLRISGEHVFPVPPLTSPEPEQLQGQDLERYEAVRLFVERTRAVRPGFVITSENARAVAEICSRLDGLPLAIELAAARARYIPPQTLAARLGSQLALLTGGAQDLPARQQTLRATLDWSYSLLPVMGQRLLAWLAVFVGGCTLESAEAVYGERGGDALSVDDEAQVLDGISLLVDHGLLREEERPAGEARFQMPETARQYALARLAESGESEAAHRRHAEYFLALAEAAEPGLTGPQQAEWLNRLDVELDNLRAALLWAHESGQVELGLRLAGALGWFWLMRGYFTEGRAACARALSTAGGSKRARAKVLTSKGMLAWRQGNYQRAAGLLNESLAVYRELGEVLGTAHALHHLAHVYEAQGSGERAVELFEESLGLFRELRDRWGLTLTLNCLGNALVERGEHDRATGLIEEALDIATKAGDRHGMADSFRLLGIARLRRDDGGRAGPLLEESAALFRSLRDRQGMLVTLRVLVQAVLREGEYGRASELSQESLLLAEDLGDTEGIAESLRILAAVAAGQGKFDRAARLLGTAAAVHERLGISLAPKLMAEETATMMETRAQLGEESFESFWRQGRAMTVGQAVTYALESGTEVHHDNFHHS